MSHSGSHTPTTNNPTISNINNPQSSASRAQILDDIPPAEHLTEDLARPPATPPSLEPQIAESSSKRRAASESSTENPMAKRMRRESPETQDRASRHNSSSSDLQDESDEMVEERAKRSEPLASPPKKKRTRTLTTPQQFAVLQALLAKSRFPTTAMREDVGRSIGLSARKVQIWFQNQRQKARRPRSQSDTPLTRPPQYGPFPNVTGSSSSSRGFEEYPTARMPYIAQSIVPEVQPPSDTPARLLGPGMPGPAVYNPHPYHPIPGPSTSAIPIESRFPGSHPPRRSESPRYYHSRSPGAPSSFHTSVRYPTSQPSHWHRRERDPLRTLPPLVPSSSYSTRRTHAPSSSLPSRLTHNPPYPISPESRFTPRHVSPEIYSRPGITLPPPFAMQPSPQWNPTSHPTAFRSDPRHRSSLWSRRDSRSTIERPIPTVTARRECATEASTTDPLEGHQHPERGASPPRPTSSHSMPPSSSLALPPRLGRYDPVRATFITRPSPTPTTPRARSPASVQQSGEDNEEEIKDDRKSPISPKESH